MGSCQSVEARVVKSAAAILSLIFTTALPPACARGVKCSNRSVRTELTPRSGVAFHSHSIINKSDKLLKIRG